MCKNMENVSILQSHSIYKEINEDCILCKMKRKRFLEVEMGPISDSQLTLAPPFWMCQVDLFGPITVMVPGFERETRNRRVLEAKCWVMVAVCPTTRLVNLQTMESSKAAGWLDAFTRLGCEVGLPSHVYCDQDSAGMSAFDMAEVELRDLQLRLLNEKNINFSVCPVTGHDKHGHVERVIRSLQESFNDCGLKKVILHATGLQTLCKLAESQYNNLPLGYHYDRDADNSPLLRILTPNMLRVGRVNKRAVDGPIRIPKSRLEILSRVNETYDSWFKIWADTMVPKLLYQPKWFRTEKELKIGDLVYFPRAENPLDKKWLLGVVESMERGRDGLIRAIDIKYQNASENWGHYQVTNRTIRKVVKLWSVEDLHLDEDMAELTRRFKAAQEVMERNIPGGEQQHCDPGQDDQADDDQHGGVEEDQHEGVMVDDIVTNDMLLQVGDDAIPGEEGDLVEQPGGDVPNPQPGGEGGPASNTRSRKNCVKCCCIAHHSLALHLRTCQIGEVPVLACQLECQTVSKLFCNQQSSNTSKQLNSIEGVLWAVGKDLCDGWL